MAMFTGVTDLVSNLNALAGGFFIVATFGIVVARQVRACLRFFILQSFFLAVSAFLLGMSPFSAHLMAVGAINLVAKVWILPWILLHMLSDEVYTRREIDQVVSIPASLIIALVLTIVACFFSLPWLRAVSAAGAPCVNIPIGLAGLFLGTYTLTARREAIPQLLGLLAMENGAFFAGIAIAPDLPLIAELALVFDLLILIFVVAILTRRVHKRIGTTTVGMLARLREEPYK